MKKFVIFGCFGGYLLFCQPLMAQEKGPLAMRIVAEWEVIGALAGAGVGSGIWMLDPGKENNHLGEQMLRGASWGVLAGFGFSFLIYNLSYIPPRVADAPARAPSPLRAWIPRPGRPLLSAGDFHFGGKAVVLPAFAWDF